MGSPNNPTLQKRKLRLSRGLGLPSSMLQGGVRIQLLHRVKSLAAHLLRTMSVPGHAAHPAELRGKPPNSELLHSWLLLGRRGGSFPLPAPPTPTAGSQPRGSAKGSRIYIWTTGPAARRQTLLML